MKDSVNTALANLTQSSTALVRSALSMGFAAGLLAILSISSASAEQPSPGVTLLEQIDDPALYDRLHSAGEGIVSPDRKHLYLHRSSNPDAMVSVLALDAEANHRPFYIRSYGDSCCDDTALIGPNLTLTDFNPTGTIAYARFGKPGISAHQFSQWGVVVLQRDPTTGDLTELQRIGIPALSAVTSGPTVTADGRHLYISYAPVNSSSPDVAALRTYQLQTDTGLLGTHTSITLDDKYLTDLTLITDDTALLASSDTSLIEYQRNTLSGELTRRQTTSLPVLAANADGEVPPSGPVAIAVTANGRSLYAQRKNPNTVLNTFDRNPSNGELRLIDQINYAEFPSNGLLLNPRSLLLTQAEEALLVPSYYARWIAGSPSISACVNAFARNAESGLLHATGTQCNATNIGNTWVPYPGKDLYYTNASLPGNLYGSNNTGTTQLAIWGLGRINQTTHIHSAALPTSRSVGERDTNEEPATYFTSVINPGTSDALQCRIDYDGDLPISVRFQINDPITNEPLNPESFDSEFEVPADGVQYLSLSVFQYGQFPTSNVALNYSCVNTENAPQIQGVTTVLMSSSILPLPDLIAGTATVGNDGIARLPSLTGTGFFAVSTINIGAEDEIRAVPVFTLGELVSDLTNPAQLVHATLSICETNPVSGECFAPPAAETVRRIANQEIATYTVFVTGNGNDIALSPGINRAFIAFVDSTGEVRGASSVAITTIP